MKKQFNSSKNEYGINIVRIEQSNDELYFNESFTVSGENVTVQEIYASYDLTILCKIEAKKIETNGVLTVMGDLIADKVKARKIICSGQIKVGDLVCDDEVMCDSINVKNADLTGNILINKSMSISNKFNSTANVLSGEGIMGTGDYNANTTVVVDYFDVDNIENQNYVEISEEFKNIIPVIQNTESPSVSEIIKGLQKVFNEKLKNVEDEEEIVKLFEEASNENMESFKIMEFILNAIIEVSYQDKIEDLNQYLYVMYAKNTFTNELINYETLEHVFNSFLGDVNFRELQFKPRNIVDFIIGLYINYHILDNDEWVADQIFSSIGIRYATVKKQFLISDLEKN